MHQWTVTRRIEKILKIKFSAEVASSEYLLYEYASKVVGGSSNCDTGKVGAI